MVQHASRSANRVPFTAASFLEVQLIILKFHIIYSVDPRPDTSHVKTNVAEGTHFILSVDPKPDTSHVKTDEEKDEDDRRVFTIVAKEDC